MQFRLPTGMSQGIVVNQSEEGLYIQSHRLLKIGSFFTVLIPGEEVSLLCEVMWNRPALPPDATLGGMGVKILETHSAPVGNPSIEPVRHAFHVEGDLWIYPHLLSFLEASLHWLGDGMARQPQPSHGAQNIGDWISWKATTPSIQEAVGLSGIVVGQEHGEDLLSLSEGSIEEIQSFMARLRRSKTVEDPFSHVAPEEGQLGDLLVPQILASLYEKKRTVLLHLTREYEEKKIYVKDGEVVYVSSSATESLGRFLMEQGFISTQEYIQTSRDNESTQSRSLDLLHQGVLDGAKLFKSLTEHQSYKLFRAFRWLHGHYKISTLKAWPEGIAELSPMPLSKLWEGIERTYPGCFVRAWLGLTDRSTFRAKTLSNENLPTPLFKLLRSLHDEISLAELSKKHPNDPRWLSRLFVCLLMGWAHLYSHDT